MFKNEALLVWILTYEAYCSEQCFDEDGVVFDCEYGCCGNIPDRYCCTFQVWIIILFSFAGAAVLIPVAVIIFCCIRDKTCPGKSSVQENPRRQAVQLRAMTRDPGSWNTTDSASSKTACQASINTAGSASGTHAGSASILTAGSSSSNTAGSSSIYTAGSSSMYIYGTSSMYGGANRTYTARP